MTPSCMCDRSSEHPCPLRAENAYFFCLKSLFYIFIEYIFYFLNTECNLRCKVDEIPFRKTAAVHNTRSEDLDTFA